VAGTLKSELGAAKIKLPCSRGCGLIIEECLLRDHVKNECENRIVICRWGCGLSDLFFKEKETHEMKECLLRRVPCTEGCGEIVAGTSVRQALFGLTAT